MCEYIILEDLLYGQVKFLMKATVYGMNCREINISLV